MGSNDEQRMIHIRIDRNVHRDLRRAAAEYDLTIQDIVSGAVERTVEGFAETGELKELSYTVEIQDEGEAFLRHGDPEAVDISDRLRRIEGKLDDLTAMMAKMMGEDNGKS